MKNIANGGDLVYEYQGQPSFLKSWALGVPATSQILMADSQKLSFSILRKVPFLIF